MLGKTYSLPIIPKRAICRGSLERRPGEEDFAHVRSVEIVGELGWSDDFTISGARPRSNLKARVVFFTREPSTLKEPEKHKTNYTSGLRLKPGAKVDDCISKIIGELQMVSETGDEEHTYFLAEVWVPADMFDDMWRFARTPGSHIACISLKVFGSSLKATSTICGTEYDWHVAKPREIGPSIAGYLFIAGCLYEAEDRPRHG
jgi:hypothetical protein